MVETEHEINSMMAVIHEGIGCAVLDMNGKYVKVNPGFCKMTGYKEEEIVGQSYEILEPHSRNPEFWTQIKDTLLSGNVWHSNLRKKR